MPKVAKKVLEEVVPKAEVEEVVEAKGATAKHPLSGEEVSTATWEWVDMPSEGVINDFVPKFSIASQRRILEFFMGGRYFLPKDMAEELRLRIKNWRSTELRILHGHDPEVVRTQRRNHPSSEFTTG